MAKANRVLSTHKRHEVLLKLQGGGLPESVAEDALDVMIKAGLRDKGSQDIVDSKDNELGRAFAAAVNFSPKAVCSTTTFARDMTKDGWELKEDVREPASFPISDLELVSVLKKRETSVSGNALQDRAKAAKALMGQCHAEYLLEHQDEIPAEWRSNYLVFPGTVWRGSRGSRRVPYLYWYGGRWSLRFIWLDGGWYSYVRFVRPRNS